MCLSGGRKVIKLRTSHHHVHTALAAAVGRDGVDRVEPLLLGPASGGDLVHGQFRILRPREGGSPACHEEEAGIMGFEQQRHEGGCHDLGADYVDIPGGGPCLAHC